MPTDISQDIRDRTFRFACAVAALVLKFGTDYRLRSLVDQLIRSATSVGANMEEAKAASTRREFLRFAQSRCVNHAKRSIGCGYVLS
jgi:four helix bundle protein